MLDEYNGFIYETTCIVTGMKYIGRHGRSGNPSDPDDSWYLGSSLNPQFWVDLETYGEENFVREILDPGPYTLEEAVSREGERLREVDAANNNLYYNLSNWSGVHDQAGEKNPVYGKTWTQSEETCKKKSEALKKYKKTTEHCIHISESKKGQLTGDDNPMRRSEIREQFSERLKGEGNPMYGKIGEAHHLYGCHYDWYTDGSSNKRIREGDKIPVGFYPGFTQVHIITEVELAKRRESRARVVYERVCKLCGTHFQSRSGNARYCENCR